MIDHAVLLAIPLMLVSKCNLMIKLVIIINQGGFDS